MRYALVGFALGFVLCGAIFWGVYSTATADAEKRLDDSLKRGRVLLADAQGELERERADHERTRGNLDDALGKLGVSQKRLAGSLAELGRLRRIQAQDGSAIDSSLEGIARIRAIIEGLPLLE